MARAVRITISERVRALLERWTRNLVTTPCRLKERCDILLLSAGGLTNKEQARRLGIDQQRVARWRVRWAENERRVAEAEREGASDKDLGTLLRSLLDDVRRSGTPPTFSAEQLAQIIAIACERPEDSGVPVSRWTPPEIAKEAIKRGIVRTISPRHVDRLLKGGISARTRAGTG
jgi:putative transposase